MTETKPMTKAEIKHQIRISEMSQRRCAVGSLRWHIEDCYIKAMRICLGKIEEAERKEKEQKR